MKYRVITPSSVFPCDLTFLKDQLRITHTAHDVYLTSLIAAATKWATGHTGRQINYATLQGYQNGRRGYLAQVFQPGFARLKDYFDQRSFIIERGPIISITKIQYLNLSGELIEITTANYDLQRDEYSGTIYLKSTFNFIDIDYHRDDAIQITYTAGYGGDFEDAIPFPEIVRNAIALKAAQLYTRPEDGVDEKTSISENLLRDMKCPIV